MIIVVVFVIDLMIFVMIMMANIEFETTITEIEKISMIIIKSTVVVVIQRN